MMALFTASKTLLEFLFQSLHRLPVQERIEYKINALCYKCIMRSALSYLGGCLQIYTPSRTLRSASDTLSLQIPRIRLSTVGSRALSVFGPSTLSDLPLPLRQNPLWTHLSVFSQHCIHVFRSVLLSSSVSNLFAVRS